MRKPLAGRYFRKKVREKNLQLFVFVCVLGLFVLPFEKIRLCLCISLIWLSL